jgi:hypothetical protein
MKKKLPSPDAVVPKEILERAKQSVYSERPDTATKNCVVCGQECAPNSSEGLCWVCRRLKISAWGESDQQLSAQE